MTWETAYGSDYEIQVSNDNKTYRTIVTKVNGFGGIEEFSDLNIKGRYVRMSGTKRGTSWGYSLYEMEVFS